MKQFYYINQYIRADQLRVIGDDSTQYGVISKQEAINKAQELGQDLVLVAPNAKPPVAKIIDFAKFKYQQEKKEQSARKKTADSEIKEFRMTPFMAENDLNVRLNRARKFLMHKDKVRFNLWFKGRQITRKQFGYDLFKRVVENLKDVGAVESDPKLKGKILQMTIKPVKGGQIPNSKSQIPNKL